MSALEIRSQISFTLTYLFVLSLVSRCHVDEVDALQLAGRWYNVRRDPDAKDGNVDAGNDNGCAPFEPRHGACVLCNNGNSIDNDLHEELDFKHPQEQDEEQDGNSAATVRIK